MHRNDKQKFYKDEQKRISETVSKIKHTIAVFKSISASIVEHFQKEPLSKLV